MSQSPCTAAEQSNLDQQMNPVLRSCDLSLSGGGERKCYYDSMLFSYFEMDEFLLLLFCLKGLQIRHMYSLIKG